METDKSYWTLYHSLSAYLFNRNSIFSSDARNGKGMFSGKNQSKDRMPTLAKTLIKSH